MVSVVVIGPSMSGKTTLCSRLVGFGDDEMALQQTRSCSYMTMEVDNRTFHIWDTPALTTEDEITQGWPGEGALEEADVVIVCHDGRHVGPMALVQACGPSRCIVALTRTAYAAMDVSYCLEYLRTTCDDGSLVPRVHGRDMLLSCLWQKTCACARVSAWCGD